MNDDRAQAAEELLRQRLAGFNFRTPEGESIEPDTAVLMTITLSILDDVRAMATKIDEIRGSVDELRERVDRRCCEAWAAAISSVLSDKKALAAIIALASGVVTAVISGVGHLFFSGK